jgi:hypothetical protein
MPILENNSGDYMVNLICRYCGYPIYSRDEFVLGTHFFKMATPYHEVCFANATNDNRVPDKPLMKVPYRQLKLFLSVNIFSIMFGFVLILMAFFSVMSIALIIPGCIALIFGSVFAGMILRYEKLLNRQDMARALGVNY